MFKKQSPIVTYCRGLISSYNVCKSQESVSHSDILLSGAYLDATVSVMVKSQYSIVTYCRETFSSYRVCKGQESVSHSPIVTYCRGIFSSYRVCKGRLMDTIILSFDWEVYKSSPQVDHSLNLARRFLPFLSCFLRVVCLWHFVLLRWTNQSFQISSLCVCLSLSRL